MQNRWVPAKPVSESKDGEEKCGKKKLFPAQRDERRALRQRLRVAAPTIELVPYINGKKIDGSMKLEVRDTGWYGKMKDGSHESGLQYGCERPSLYVPLDESGALFAKINSGGLWFSVTEVIADEL